MGRGLNVAAGWCLDVGSQKHDVRREVELLLEGDESGPRGSLLGRLTESNITRWQALPSELPAWLRGDSGLVVLACTYDCSVPFPFEQCP